MKTDETATSPPHEPFLMLIEKNLRGEISDAERVGLEHHLATCENCRAYAAQAQREDQTMLHAIESVHAKCDFERIEQAIANREMRERIENRITVLLIALGVAVALGAYLLGANASFIFAGTAMAVVSGAFWSYRRQLQKNWRELVKRCKAGEPIAFERFHRSARSYLAIQQAGLLVMLIMVPILGVTGVIKLFAGEWLYGIWYTATAVMLAPFLPMMWRAVFSRTTREHEEAILTGQVEEIRFGTNTSEKKPS